ncbi:hypothetical protein [Desulforamulus hydrothermalis]|uniref:PgdS peptidase n=1 Tax=Desulforamulus hydrothermalis Lam5 = DSM 18033 TaxID=1121428 RepID=K8DXS7_9FIRM|nr:hypothetical protein [Desulforamulus hydrothermalis]CCO07439.1 PgdS peptidase [Desulforamulus hydrothermalis Lam5 = DSM 18033]SHH18449.1 hypothetical protein SAMN02745177_01755 [Desulforamulus hydrothermalis Lam5 = DSM 18033]
MSEKEKAIQALIQIIAQNQARQEQQQELKEWFTRLNSDLMKAVKFLQQA